MIRSMWPYLALMLLCAGIFPALERRLRWRLFNWLPPIVWTYLCVTALAAAGLWRVEGEIAVAQSMLVRHLVPALVFLLMIHCDLRAIAALGPRVLAVFFVTTLTIVIAFIATFLLYRPWLPADAWQPLAALSGSWVGGTANMIAVKQAIGMPDSLLAMSMLADALCYSMWFALLFSIGRLAPAFNRWTGARASSEGLVVTQPESRAVTPDAVFLWLGLALASAFACGELAAHLPAAGLFGVNTWTILLATAAGLIVAHTPLARMAGASATANALLVAVVAVLASQSNFDGIAQAPLYLLCGLTILTLHGSLLVLAARLFHFDLHLCGIASLAHVGGVAATPILAASYARALVPVGILLALLGYILGTGVGLGVAALLSRLATG